MRESHCDSVIVPPLKSLNLCVCKNLWKQKRKSNIKCCYFSGEFMRAVAPQGVKKKKKGMKEYTGYAAANMALQKEFGEYFTLAYFSSIPISMLPM